MALSSYIKCSWFASLICVVSHHGPGVLPFGEFIEDAQQINTGEQVSPAELIIITSFL